MSNDIIKKLQNFHSEIDRKVKELEKKHIDRINCKAGCADCCVDDLTVFEIEAANITLNCSELLEKEIAARNGKCAFLDKKNECRIYKYRPYVCRTQGLPLSWLEEIEDGNIAEMRDICPLNDKTTPIEEIPGEDCWIIGPNEQKLYELQNEFNNGSVARISLRTMFKNK